MQRIINVSEDTAVWPELLLFMYLMSPTKFQETSHIK